MNKRWIILALILLLLCFLVSCGKGKTVEKGTLVENSFSLFLSGNKENQIGYYIPIQDVKTYLDNYIK